MSHKPSYHSYLQSLSPYNAGSEKLCCEGKVVRLCFNEGAFGPNPKAVAAAQNMLGCSHVYPDHAYKELRGVLAAKYTIDAERIVCGAGSDDLIALIARAFCGPGDEIVTSQYGFAMFPVAARAVGATPVVVPAKNMEADLDAMLAAITPKTRIIFLANPNNPTGTVLALDALHRFINTLPPHVLFVYDAAYADYMVGPDYSNGLEWVKEDGQVCVLRTFSKIYGLGGLRVGWGYFPQTVTEALNRIRNPFNVSTVAQAAALASLSDDAFAEAVRTHTAIWREKLFNELVLLGLKPVPGVGNFVLTRFADAAQADGVFHYLKDRKILLRPMNGYGLPDYLRITVGLESEMEALFAALHECKELKLGNENG